MGRFHFSGNRGFAWLKAPIPGGNTSCNPLGVDNEEQGAFGAGPFEDIDDLARGLTAHLPGGRHPRPMNTRQWEVPLE